MKTLCLHRIDVKSVMVHYEVLIDGLRRWFPLMPSVARQLKDFARFARKILFNQDQMVTTPGY